MAERDDKPKQPRRDQTDASLRIEREKADSAAAKKHRTLEEEADEVVQVARARADQIVQTARDDADRERPQSPATEAASERERGRADVELAHERSSADMALENERAQRKRYLADFLAVERDATDSNLMGERADADTVVATRDDFLAIVSHDLRSLLGGLSLNTDLLIQHAPRGAAGDVLRKHVGTSQRLIARMNRLVNDLLDVTSIEAGTLAVHREHVDVATVLHDTLEAFERVAVAKHITLSADAEPLPLFAHIDSGRILQVLVNLVSNAIKFTPAGGKVSIRSRRDGNEVVFTVVDTGIGIPDDALQGVFEKFHQVSKVRGGLGLGLHISKAIVNAHGGKIWAESKLGAGSTFFVSLPLAQNEPQR